MSAGAWRRFGDAGFKQYTVPEWGCKYNMADLLAALGIHQLARVEANWKRRPAWGEDKADLFDGHDAFVYMSRWEGLPLAVVEALASGLPVVVTEATNVADLIETYGAGWVATGDGTAALGASDDELVAAGRSAQELARAEFDWDREAVSLLSALTGSLQSIG